MSKFGFLKEKKADVKVDEESCLYLECVDGQKHVEESV